MIEPMPEEIESSLGYIEPNMVKIGKLAIPVQLEGAISQPFIIFDQISCC